MPSRFRNDERGFTLIEQLVVVVIIGIIAAIALPLFLGQQKKGSDSSAKSDARNLVTQVEACYSDSRDYQQCTTAGQLGNTGLPLGTSQGQVNITSNAATSYEVTGYSKSGNTFLITKTSGGTPTRSCTPATGNNGGCRAGSW